MLLDVFYRLRGLTLVGLAMAWQTGILLDSLLNVPLFILVAGIGFSLAGALLLYRDPAGRILLLLILCLLAGAWRYGSMLPNNDQRAVSTFVGPTRLTIRGTVAEEPELQGRSRVLIVVTSMMRRGNATSWTEVHGKIEVQVLGTGVEDIYGANYGDGVELQGKLQSTLPHSPPGIFASMVFPRVKVSNSGGNPIIGSLYHLRIACASIIAQVLPQPAAALLIAIVLGLRTPGLTPLKFAFNVTGTAHLIVPSGFKVTIVAGIVAAATRSAHWLQRVQHFGRLAGETQQRWLPWVTTALILLSIAAYTVLSGAGPAAFRAGIMGGLLILAPRIGRQYNVYTTLALSSLLMSCVDPFVLWNTGFQLSFLGTLGIVLLTPFFQTMLGTLQPLPLGHTASELIAVTLAAQVATLPIFALTFQQISFIAPIANLLTVPLLGIFIALGLVICAVGFVSLPLAQVCGWIAWPLLTYISNCILWCANLPGAYSAVSDINAGLAWAYYLLLAYITGLILSRQQRAGSELRSQKNTVEKRGKRTWRIVQACTAALFIGATGIAILSPQAPGQLSITFLDVGPAGGPAQGEAIFIRTADHKTILIDGGMDPTSLGQALDSRLPYWQRWLDMVILTTPRADHLTGLQDIVTRYHIGSIRDAGMLHPTTTYARWRRSISERGLPYAPIDSGETILIGTDAVLQVLWPGGGMHRGGNEVRDNGLILKLVAPGLHILFLGAAAQSPYALTKLAQLWPSNALRSEVVQIIGERNKELTPEARAILQKAQPALVVITPAALTNAQKKAPALVVQPQAVLPGMQVVKTEQAGSLQIRNALTGWSMDTSAQG